MSAKNIRQQLAVLFTGVASAALDSGEATTEDVFVAILGTTIATVAAGSARQPTKHERNELSSEATRLFKRHLRQWNTRDDGKKGGAE